jgi:hypothetical protein
MLLRSPFILGIVLGTVSPAHALTFGDIETTTLAAVPQGVALYTAAEDNSAYIALEDGTWAVYGSTAGTPDVPSAPGTAVAATDASLLYCSSGLLANWDGSTNIIGEQPCAGLAARDGRYLVRTGTHLALVGGSLGPLEIEADPELYALSPESASGTPIAWANRGDTQLHQYDVFGESALAIGSGITALGWGTSNWVIGTATGIRQLGETEIALSAPPTQVGSADFEGDGAPKLWAYDGVALTIIVGDTPLRVELTADQIVTGDIDGDGCDDVLGTTSTLLSVLRVSDCAGSGDPDGDGDGDGYTAADGDCAPEDGTIYPGAAEDCDGVDQDCDGVVDEANALTLSVPEAIEGTVFSFSATLDGCDSSSGIWDWSFMGEGACSANGDRANCLCLDDATITASVTYTNELGESYADNTDATVSNVAPYLYDDGVDWGDHPEALLNRLTLAENETWAAQLLASDPSTDTITYTLDSAGLPVQLTEDGLLTVTAGQALTGVFTVFLTDDDGGSSAHEFRLEVLSPATEDESTGPSSLCCGGGATAGIALSLWVLLLRRKS